MQQNLAVITVIFGFLFIRLAETYLHRRNYKYLVSLGAEEVQPRVMQLFYRWHLLLLPAALLEHLLFPRDVADVIRFIALHLLFAGFVLRLWSIYTLGGLWSMRCLFIPGLPKMEGGPYRYVDHPEYLSRLIDGAGLCLFLGSYGFLAAYLGISVFFYVRIIKGEEEQLAELAEV